MPRYLYEYVQFFSHLAAGTPEDPGGDFEMRCWIDGPDRQSALSWGHVLLGDYIKARHARSPERHLHDGRPLRGGQIVDDLAELAAAEQRDIPSCEIGEIPAWHEPWRRSNKVH